MTQVIGESLLADRLEKIPPLVDVDAHVVESPDLWSSRLPARYRDQGPRLVQAPAGEIQLIDGKYVERPGTEGPDVAWWHYEQTTGSAEALHRGRRRARRRGDARGRQLRRHPPGLLAAW